MHEIGNEIWLSISTNIKWLTQFGFCKPTYVKYPPNSRECKQTKSEDPPTDKLASAIEGERIGCESNGQTDKHTDRQI